MSEELAPRRTVVVEDADQSTEMEVYLEVEVDQHVYGLLIPLDLPVNLVKTFQEQDTDVLDPVDPETAVALSKELNTALRPWGLKSESRDEGLYLVGEPNDEFLDDCDVIEVRTDDGEEEEYAVLLEMETGDATYLVITPVVPDLFPVEFTGENSARLLNDEQLADLEETFYAALSAVEGED